MIPMDKKVKIDNCPENNCNEGQINNGNNLCAHIVVQTLNQLYNFPCKLRQNGMVATVIEDGYSEWQIQTSIEIGKCNNNSWVKITDGSVISDSTNLLLFDTDAERNAYLADEENNTVEGKLLYSRESSTYLKISDDDDLTDPFPEKLDSPREFGEGKQRYLIPAYVNGKPYWREAKDFEATLTKDVISDVTEGNIVAGEKLPEGMSFQEFVEKFLIKTFFPELIDPTISMSAGSDVEVGTPTKLITITYNPGNIKGKSNSAGIWEPGASQGPRGGAAVVYVINGEVTSSNSKVINKTTVLGENSVNGDVRYSEGQQPLDSKLNPYDEPKKSEILYGTAKWKGFFFRYAGSVGAIPTGAAIRNLTEKRNSGGVIRLNTGTINKNFVVFVPEGSTLVSAFDETSSNVDVRHLYLDKGIVNATDAGGNTVRYRLFQMTIDNTNTKNTIHVLTVT